MSYSQKRFTIGIDARIFKTGIGRVVKNLLLSLESEIDEYIDLIVFLRKDGYDSYHPTSENITKVLADFAPYSFSEQLKLLWLIRTYNVDLMHFTNFNAPILYPGPFILTIYDLIHLSFPTFGNTTKSYWYYIVKKFVYRIVVWVLAHRARFVTTISEVSKQEIIKHLNVSSDKIIVTSVGFDHVVHMDTQSLPEVGSVLEKYGITKPYLLYVATMYPHKNHKNLLMALAELVKKGVAIKLVLVGKVDTLSDHVRAMVSKMGLTDDVVFPSYFVSNGYLSDSELYVLYQNTEMVVFPSFIEGFGIPILEAQWYGKPIIASDLPVFHEVGANGVLYINPNDSHDIAQKITSVLKNDPKVLRAVENGRENIKRFLWRNVATKTIAVYRAVLELHG